MRKIKLQFVLSALLLAFINLSLSQQDPVTVLFSPENNDVVSFGSDPLMTLQKGQAGFMKSVSSALNSPTNEENFPALFTYHIKTKA